MCTQAQETRGGRSGCRSGRVVLPESYAPLRSRTPCGPLPAEPGEGLPRPLAMSWSASGQHVRDRCGHGRKACRCLKYHLNTVSYAIARPTDA